MSLDPKSRAYDPTHVPTKGLEQLAAENPTNQFLADRLAEQKAAAERRPASPLIRTLTAAEPWLWAFCAPAIAYFAIAALWPAAAHWLIGPLALAGLGIAIKRYWG